MTQPIHPSFCHQRDAAPPPAGYGNFSGLSLFFPSVQRCRVSTLCTSLALWHDECVLMRAYRGGRRWRRPRGTQESVSRSGSRAACAVSLPASGLALPPSNPKPLSPQLHRVPCACRVAFFQLSAQEGTLRGGWLALAVAGTSGWLECWQAVIARGSKWDGHSLRDPMALLGFKTSSRRAFCFLNDEWSGIGAVSFFEPPLR